MDSAPRTECFKVGVGNVDERIRVNAIKRNVMQAVQRENGAAIKKLEYLWIKSKLNAGALTVAIARTQQPLSYLPGTQKHATVADLIVFGQIEKCEVVCANCHRIRTFERQRLGLSKVGRPRKETNFQKRGLS